MMSVLAETRSVMMPLSQQPHMPLTSNDRIHETFAIVTQNLLNLGSCPLEKLADSPKADLEGFDLHVNLNSDLSASTSLETSPVNANEIGKEPSSMQYVAKLHQICHQTFGNSDCLKYEFIEDENSKDTKCILTIKRTNGQTRSYTSEATFKRKSDAKARAAKNAVKLDAVDFIQYGNRDKSTSQKLLLAPIDGRSVRDGAVVEDEPMPDSEDEFSRQIIDCCVEWRAGLIKPRWVYYTEHKGESKYGSALIVELSQHSQRFYSVLANYLSQSEAKQLCSEQAIKQGVLDFIKFGNGQTSPTTLPVDPPEHVIVKGNVQAPVKENVQAEKKGHFVAITLQDYFDTLPKPFPEAICCKSAAEINASGLLNNILQLAKGTKLAFRFYFFNNHILHGSILRLEHPEESKSYIVEPKFSKRSDAKAAVCMLALSQGIGNYIRSAAAAIESKVTPEMRKKANEVVMPILGSEYAKLRQGLHPLFEFEHDQGAFGCKLSLDLRPELDVETSRTWSVPTEYRTKVDAKTAVIYLFGQEAIEFIRFRGQPAPPDHDPFKPLKKVKEESQGAESRKSEAVKDDSPREKSAAELRPPVIKRRATTSGQVKLGVPLLETKEEAMARLQSEAGWRARNNHQNDRFSKSRKKSNSRSSSYGSRLRTRVDYGPRYATSQLPSSHSYNQPYNVSAAATAVIGRVTGSGSAPAIVHHPPPHPPPPLPPLPYHSMPPHAPYGTSHYPAPPGVQSYQSPHYPPVYSYHMPPTSPPQPPPPPPPPIPTYASSLPSPPYYPNSRSAQYPTSPSEAASYRYAPSPSPPAPARRVQETARPKPRSEPRRSSKSTAIPKSTSFDAGHSRFKRRRSREWTSSDTHLPKKQRSDSSLPSSAGGKGGSPVSGSSRRYSRK